MDTYGYDFDHDLIKFLNIFCTQMRVPDRLRNLIIAVIALCEHNVTATISINNLQELLSNLSKNSTQKRISRTQLELLFTELTRQEYGLATSLIWLQQELEQKQEQLLTLNKVEKVEENEEFVIENNLASKESKESQKIVHSNCSGNENYNDENNNSKILNNNSSNSNKQSTIGYIRDLETEAKTRTRMVTTVNDIYQSKNRRTNSVNSHYT